MYKNCFHNFVQFLYIHHYMLNKYREVYATKIFIKNILQKVLISWITELNIRCIDIEEINKNSRNYFYYVSLQYFYTFK